MIVMSTDYLRVLFPGFQSKTILLTLIAKLFVVLGNYYLNIITLPQLPSLLAENCAGAG